MEKDLLKQFDDKIDYLNTFFLPLLPGYFPGSGAKSIQQLDELKDIARELLHLKD